MANSAWSRDNSEKCFGKNYMVKSYRNKPNEGGSERWRARKLAEVCQDMYDLKIACGKHK